MDAILDIYGYFFGPDVVIAPQYLVLWVCLGWAIYRVQRNAISFTEWLFPKRIWTSRSSWIDIKLFAIGRTLALAGIVSRFVATPLVAQTVAGLMPWSNTATEAQLSPILLALLMFLISDLAIYCSHWAHHRIKAIWPLHAVHHSAEVLTPITAYRQHPVGTLVNASFQSVVIGGLWGVTIGVFDHSASLAEIAGANAFVVIANMTIANFHHSHIWVGFNPFWERIFISPAQHQIHHSTDPAHFNKNFGNILAIWDWAFGTLHLSQGVKEVSLGLDDEADAPLMTHRLWPILVSPIRRLFGLSP